MSNSKDLKSMGLKATFPRLKILELFEKSEIRHLTAEDVYRLLLAENMDIQFTAPSPSLNRPDSLNGTTLNPVRLFLKLTSGDITTI
jgi:Ferric uptake regulator family